MLKSILFSVALVSTAFAQQEITFSANTKTSNVHWLGKKTTGQHDGNVGLKSGSILFNGNTPVTGEFVLDMKSITCNDIKNAEDNQGLVDHLKGKDFFDVDGSPESVLKITRFESGAEANTYIVTANLTIKGITNAITFPATVTVEKKKAKATASITIDRTKWNISYKSKSILGGLADKFIYDDIQFTVSLDLAAAK